MPRPFVTSPGFNVSIQSTALRLKGERRSIKANMCTQAKGNGPIKRLVRGFKKNIKSKTAFNNITGPHFRLIKNPRAIALIVAGRKSRNIKVTGFPIAIARKVPRKTLKPPTYGPRRTPYIGARISEREKAPAIPIMGIVGINLIIVYKAEKMAIDAIIFVLVLRLLSVLTLLSPSKFFTLACNFLHTNKILP